MNKKVNGGGGGFPAKLGSSPTPQQMLASYRWGTSQMPQIIPQNMIPMMGENSILAMNHVNAREVIGCEGIKSSDKNAVLLLYDALVRNAEIRKRPVNIALIINEGFPAFEMTIGQDNFKKIKQYYGIGYEPDKTILAEAELNKLLSQLRTIECACHYIHGYQETIDFMASCMDGNPKKVKNVSPEKHILSLAKLATVAAELFCGYWYLTQDFVPPKNKPASSVGRDTVKHQNAGQVSIFFKNQKARLVPVLPNYDASIENDKNPYGPEDLIIVAEKKLKPRGKECIFTDMLMHEVFNLKEKGLLAEVMSFAELEFTEGPDGWDFRSINIPNPFNTVAMVRDLKKRMNPELGVYPMETFLFTDVKSEDFEDIWHLDMMLRAAIAKGGLPKLPREMKNFCFSDGKKMRRQVYMIGKDEGISCVDEALRIIQLAKFLHDNDVEMCQRKGKRVHVGQLMEAISLAQALACTNAFIATTAMEIGNEILGMPNAEALLKAELQKSLNSGDEKKADERKADVLNLMKALGITREQLLRWGCPISAFSVKEPVDLPDDDARMKFIISLAREKKYLASETEVDDEQMRLIKKVIIDGNNEAIQKFAHCEMSMEEFKKAIGFEDCMAEMYFDRSQVDEDLLTEHCLKLQRKLKQKKNRPDCACTVRLYKVLVDEKVPCGPDMKVIARNPSLKGFNYRA